MNSITRHRQFPQARLSIFISGTPVLQGKYYTLNEKPVFLVNIDDNKLFRNYNGYAIAAQIVETFKKAKLRPIILYKHITRNLIYQTTLGKFTSKGALVNYGGHRQYVLSIPHWTFFKDDLNEPYNLPSMSVDQWLKPPVKMLHIDPEQKLNSMLRLKQLWQTIEK
jgi:hypothetical protein